jgi:hypothetical protein
LPRDFSASRQTFACAASGIRWVEVFETPIGAIANDESLADSFDIFALNFGKFRSQRRREFTAIPREPQNWSLCRDYCFFMRYLFRCATDRRIRPRGRTSNNDRACFAGIGVAARPSQRIDALHAGL